MGNAATIRAQVEGMLEARIPSALSPKVRALQNSISCGIKDIDRLKAFPRGTLVEICGLPSTGRTTLLYGLLATCTAGGKQLQSLMLQTRSTPFLPLRQGLS
jgi:hypothetical protein